MIPDFKTYIGESVWSDIHRRSNGSSVRKEDELTDIFNYLNSTYRIIYSFDGDKIEINDDSIHIPVFKCTRLNMYSSININDMSCINFSSTNPNKYRTKGILGKIKDPLNELYTNIKQTFSVDVSEFDGIDHWYDFKVKPKDGGKITKQFCEEFIDLILRDERIDPRYDIRKVITKRTNESVWSDIHNRSTGKQVRVEDDVDLMDKDRLWDYLNDIYEQTTTIYDIRLYTIPYDCILVPISINGLYRSSSVSYLGLEGFEDPKGMVVTLDGRSIARLTEEVVGELSKKYNMKLMPETSKRQAYAKITPKDGSPVTNTFYIEVIDFLLDNIKDGYNRLLKKKER